jgi:hypothetical protein
VPEAETVGQDRLVLEEQQKVGLEPTVDASPRQSPLPLQSQLVWQEVGQPDDADTGALLSDHELLRKADSGTASESPLHVQVYR